MSALFAQRLIAAPFLILGAWCLLFPEMVERLTLRPEYYRGDTVSTLLIGCFGAQAVLAGLFAASSRFTRTTFAVFGVALLPFLWFNYWFVFEVPVLNAWMALDLACNLAMLALCVVGWRAGAGNG